VLRLLLLERHPDNVAASLFGGFVGTYLNELKPEDVARIEIPLSEVLPTPAGGIDTGKRPPEPPVGIGHYRRFGWAKEIKAIAIIPDFVVPTANARGVLPEKYTRADVVGSISLDFQSRQAFIDFIPGIQSAARRTASGSFGHLSARS
jgi:homoserine kinase